MQTKYQMAFRAFLSTYAYHQALLVASHALSPEAQLLLTSLKERRELNVQFLYDHFEALTELSQKYGLPELADTVSEEQLVNYIYDLEAKVKSGQLIDFVRSVSPIIYRLLLRLLLQEIPELAQYIKNARNQQYDRWRFDRMMDSKHPAIQSFISRKRDSRVTSSSLLELLLETTLPAHVKTTAQTLRQFERSVRNPLAHLIKPFDEEELHRTTGFSSQLFLEKIISLAKASGLHYETQIFYFDKANAILSQGMIIE